MDHGRRVGGYFSVEAALVLPVVLGVYLFLITMLFVQYDRCLLEQDMASMLIKACNHSGTSRQQLTYLQELTAAWSSICGWNCNLPILPYRDGRSVWKLQESLSCRGTVA